jgi:hypothetical protein
MAIAKGPESRTFRVPGLEHEDGSAVFNVGGKSLLAVDVRGGSGKLTTKVGGAPRVVTTLDSKEVLDGIVDGQLHPVVAALQGRLAITDGDRVFALCVLLALRASAPRFAQGGS